MYFGRADLKNITIDDTLSSINGETVVYEPFSAWNYRGSCFHPPCSISPDINKIESGTWHESSFHSEASNQNDFPNQPLSATTKFHGSAVYVYAVLPPSTGSKPPTAAVTFYIDGVLVNEFSSRSFPDYVYDVLVYENSSMPLDSHEIKIVNGEVDGVTSRFILDRIVYSTSTDPDPPPISTSADPSTSTSPQNPISSSNTSQHINSTSLPPGVIVGIVLGSLAGLIAIIMIILRFRIRCSGRYRYQEARLNSSWGPGVNGGNFDAHPNGGPRTGWRIASDSRKRALLGDPPPAYHI